jgi:lipopolysaccharide export system permease protein
MGPERPVVPRFSGGVSQCRRPLAEVDETVTIIDRYVLGRFLRMLPMCIGAAAALFLMVDFFQRIADLASYHSTAGQIAGYFLFKLPRILTEIYPAGCLLAVLIGVGGLAEGGELLALKACGVSTARLLVPLAIVGVVSGFGVLLWNEIVVPPCYTRARLIRDVGIEKELESGLFDAASIWYRSDQGFVNIAYFDATDNELNGIALHVPDAEFHVGRLVEVPRAVWTGSGWSMEGGFVTTFVGEGDPVIRDAQPGDLVLDATPQELRSKRRRSFEFSYRALSKQIASLQRKGLDATEYLVDLQYKLAAPFAGLIAIVIGMPLAMRSAKRGARLIQSVGVGLAVSLVYWATAAVAVAAGHAAVLPPWAAAWAANALFGAGGLVLYRRGDV